MTQLPGDHQSARRRAVIWMFIGLMIGVISPVLALIYAVHNAPGGDNSQFIQGIVLTAIAGVMLSSLSFIGIIIKEIVDNLTREDPT